jgi:hypothetical protein
LRDKIVGRREAGDVLLRASRSPEHAASRKPCTLLRAAANRG